MDLFTVQMQLHFGENEELCKLSDSGKLYKDYTTSIALCVFQDGEDGKEEEEKENFGKLEYTLDYNFTDNQVSAYSLVKYSFHAYKSR